MNEVVLDHSPGLASSPFESGRRILRGRSAGFYGYVALLLSIAAGFLLRDYQLISPEEGIGYWLGIVGGTIMLFLLLYPLRKRFRFLHVFGSTRQWFRLHMILGLLGPLLVLYHCNFRLGSFNSRVALYCMLLVALSGVVGKHFYARIHNGLYGKKTSLKELQAELGRSRSQNHGLATVFPRLSERIESLCGELQGDEVTQSLGIGRSLKWAVSRHFVRLSLYLTARRELRFASLTSDTVRKNRARLQRSASRYIRNSVNLMVRVAQFTFYERLFSLWHVFHLPFFFMLVLSALIHVLAVHMY